jgi:AraC-like DNA-binding protein
MDVLTDVFTAMRVESVVYGRLELTAPWGFNAEAFQQTTFDAKFGLIVRGNCWLSVEGIPEPIPLTGGDCYVLTHGHDYGLRDSPHTRTQPFTEVLRGQRGDVTYYGGGGVPTTIIGGIFKFDGPNGKPLIDLLPPLIHVRAGQARTLALQTTLQLLAAETAAPGPGSQLVASRLADILFVQVIRTYLAYEEPSKTGWLGALSHPQIGAALKAMHEQIEHSWSVAALASEVGMSRSAFALRFKQVVGESPLEYLTHWRMYKASRLLREGDRKLIEIANAVGYDSDAAFNKAFKRVLGVTPGEYRQKRLPRVARSSR